MIAISYTAEHCHTWRTDVHSVSDEAEADELRRRLGDDYGVITFPDEHEAREHFNFYKDTERKHSPYHRQIARLALSALRYYYPQEVTQ